MSFQNQVAKKVVKHQVNQKMSNRNNNRNNNNNNQNNDNQGGGQCQCILGKFTVAFGAVVNACGAGVGIGSLAFLGEKTTQASSNIALMVVGNSLSLTIFCLMLLVSFTMPKYVFIIPFFFF